MQLHFPDALLPSRVAQIAEKFRATEYVLFSFMLSGLLEP
jgi:hypothetical protein